MMKTQTVPKVGVLAASVVVLVGAAFYTAERPTLSRAGPAISATSRSLDKDCVSAGLELPIVDSALLANPGSSPENQKKPGLFQTGLVTPKAIAAMPQECTGQFDRTEYLWVAIQNPAKRKFYRTISRPKWQYINGNHEEHGLGDNALTKTVDSANGLPKNYYFKPTPGPRVTHVVARFKNTVTLKSTGQIVGTKYGPKFPVKVAAPRRAQ